MIQLQEAEYCKKTATTTWADEFLLHRSVPCLGYVVLGLHSDLLTVNFVRRLTGVSVTADHEVGVVVSISWEADEHPQPAFEDGCVNTREL